MTGEHGGTRMRSKDVHRLELKREIRQCIASRIYLGMHADVGVGLRWGVYWEMGAQHASSVGPRGVGGDGIRRSRCHANCFVGYIGLVSACGIRAGVQSTQGQCQWLST